MSQPPNPPNPPSGGTPGQPPDGWNPEPDPRWATDPTQQLPAGQQYPPTQPLPAAEQNPGQYGQNPGQYGQNPAQGPYPGQYGPPGGQYTQGQYPGQEGAPGGQYGPNPGGGQYGPPGGGFGAPPSGAPSGGSGGGRSQVPLIIGIVAGVLVLGLLAWFLFFRPSSTAGPAPSSAVPSTPATSASPSVLITPSSSPSSAPSERPSGSASTRPSGTTSAACASELSANQCDWAVYMSKYVVVPSCRPDSSDVHRDAFTCAANTRGKLDGNATVSLRWGDDSADMVKLMNGFFERSGVAKSEIGSNWKKPPALTNWWFNDRPKDIIGKLGSADQASGGGVAWTYKKQRFFAEATSDTDSAAKMIEWWANS